MQVFFLGDRAISAKVGLANYLSRLVWSWPELQHLLDHAETPERREKLTGSRLNSGATIEAVHEAVNAVKEDRKGEAISVKAATSNGLIVGVRYSEFDPSRTRLQQRVEREVTIELERSDEGYSIRHQASDKAREVVRAIVARLEADSKATFDASEITLSGVSSPELRTEFFVALMTSMLGFNLRNVTSVSVDRANTEGEANGENDEEGGDSATEEAATMLGVVKKAVFEGQSLLTSREFQSLKVDGFSLSRAVWRSSETAGDGAEFEFEADFEDTKDCTGFRYNVRGVYERRTRGEEGIKKTRSPVPPDRRGDLLHALETSARSALAKVLADASPPVVASDGDESSDGEG
jgi:hypothetical protein